MLWYDTVLTFFHFFFAIDRTFQLKFIDPVANVAVKRDFFNSVFKIQLKNKVHFSILSSKKMFHLHKIFIILCVIMHTNAIVSIDLDAAELQSIGELLVETYMRHNLIRRVPTIKSVILTKIMRCSYSLLQMIGVTISLIAANVYSPFFGMQFAPTTPPTPSTTTTTSTTITLPANTYSKLLINPSKMCPNDFGCDRNICWRSCSSDGKEDSAVSWCYTTSDPKSTKYAPCIHRHDCSACWECLGICHSPKQ